MRPCCEAPQRRRYSFPTVDDRAKHQAHEAAKRRRATKRRKTAASRSVKRQPRDTGEANQRASSEQTNQDAALLKEMTKFANLNVLRNPTLPSRQSTEWMPPIVAAVRSGIEAMLPSRPRKLPQELFLPDLREYESLSLYCDFAGDGGEGTHAAYSFLLCAFSPRGFTDRMQRIRGRFRLGTREIAYKNLSRQAGIRAALPEYFWALDNLVPGFLLTVSVPHEMTNMIMNQDGEDELLVRELSAVSAVCWKPHVLQKALRVFHLGAFMISLLCREGQKLFWMSDNDAVIANRDLHRLAAAVFLPLIDDYCRFKLDKFAFAPPFEDRSDMTHIDLLSATDLAAGVFRQIVARLEGRNPVSRVTTEALEDWIGKSGIALRKANIRISRGTSDSELEAYVVGDLDPKGQLVPISW